jgi:hypothetical protein
LNGHPVCLAVAWDNDSARKFIYLNGKLIAINSTDLINASPITGQEVFTLNDLAAPGIYEAVAMYDRVLPESRILQLAQAGAGAVLSDDQLADVPAETARPLVLEPLHYGEPADSIVNRDEEIELTFLVRNATGDPLQATLQMQMENFWGSVGEPFSEMVELAPGETRRIRQTVKQAQSGIFRLAVRVPGLVEEPVDVASWAVFDEMPPADPQGSFFGNHVNAWSGNKYLRQALRLGQTWMRDHNMLQSTWWCRLQPGNAEQEEIYQYEAIELLKEKDIPVLGQFFGTPRWALGETSVTMAPYTAAPPPSDLLANYVSRVVHTFPQINCWEIGNEPAVVLFWSGSPEQFADYAKTVYETAKAERPELFIMLGGFTRDNVMWQRKAVEAGAIKYCDAVSVHIPPYNEEPEIAQEKVMEIVNFWQEMARDYGGPQPLRIWSTEGGMASTTFLRGLESPELPKLSARPPLDWKEAAVRMVKSSLVMMEAGVEKHFLYLQNPRPDIARAYFGTTMLDVNYAPKPVLLARCVLARFVDGSEYWQSVRRESDGRFWAEVFDGMNADGQPQSTAVLWLGQGGEGTLTLPAGFAAETACYDFMGNLTDGSSRSVTLTDVPLYLRASMDADALAAALEQADIRITRAPAPLNDGKNTGPLNDLPDFVAPSETPEWVRPIPLDAVANMGLDDPVAGDGEGGWSDEGPMNNARDLPVGEVNLAGVPFVIVDPAQNGGRAVVTLKGLNATPSLPAQSAPIPVNSKVRNLYFLHAASWTLNEDIGSYEILYADGTTESVKLINGDNIANWWSTDPLNDQTRLVAFPVSNTATGKTEERYLQVLQWQNPKIQVPVKSVVFKSTGQAATPILVGLTSFDWQ